MGSIRNGGNGAFSGKAGSFIGSSWRDINYIKGLPKLSSKPKTEKQLEQQAKFALGIKFLTPVKPRIEIGFGNTAQGRSTSFNQALRMFVTNAVTGTYPDYEINYPLVSFSHGPLAGLSELVVTPAAIKLELSWSNVINRPNSYMGDEMIFMVYEPTEKEYVLGPPNTVRNAGAAEIDIPADWIGKLLHVYVFCVSQEKGQVSNTHYGGAVTAA